MAVHQREHRADLRGEPELSGARIISVGRIVDGVEHHLRAEARDEPAQPVDVPEQLLQCHLPGRAISEGAGEGASEEIIPADGQRHHVSVEGGPRAEVALQHAHRRRAIERAVLEVAGAEQTGELAGRAAGLDLRVEVDADGITQGHVAHGRSQARPDPVAAHFGP